MVKELLTVTVRDEKWFEENAPEDSMQSSAFPYGKKIEVEEIQDTQDTQDTLHYDYKCKDGWNYKKKWLILEGSEEDLFGETSESLPAETEKETELHHIETKSGETCKEEDVPKGKDSLKQFWTYVLNNENPNMVCTGKQHEDYCMQQCPYRKGLLCCIQLTHNELKQDDHQAMKDQARVQLGLLAAPQNRESEPVSKTDYYTKKDDKGKEELLIPECCVKEIFNPTTEYIYARMLRNRPNMSIMTMLIYIQNVLLFGLKKYGKNTWQKVPEAKARYLSAWYRHLSVPNITDLDPDSGLPHESHALCNIMFLLYFEIQESNHSKHPIKSVDDFIMDTVDKVAIGYMHGVFSQNTVDKVRVDLGGYKSEQLEQSNRDFELMLERDILGRDRLGRDKDGN